MTLEGGGSVAAALKVEGGGCRPVAKAPSDSDLRLVM